MWFGGSAVNFVFKNDSNGNITQIQKHDPKDANNVLKVTTSRAYGFINRLTKRYVGEYCDVIRKGSALKFMLLVDGLADIYPRTIPCMEWDTAAGHALLLALDRDIKELLLDGHLGDSLNYNKVNLENPYFIAQ